MELDEAIYIDNMTSKDIDQKSKELLNPIKEIARPFYLNREDRSKNNRQKLMDDELEEFKSTPLDKKVSQVYEAEEWVLACMFDDDSCLYGAMDCLNEDNFFDGAHREIFKTCLDLKKEGVPIDLSTIAQRLEGRVKHLSYFIKDYYPTTETFEYWLRYLKRFSLEQKLRKEAEQPNIDLEKVDSIISEIMVVDQAEPLYVPISQVKDLKYDESTLIKTGLVDVDRFLVFRPKNVLVVAGRKGEGKTSFGLNMLHFMSKQYPVGVISLEMTREEIKARVQQAFPGALLPQKNFFIADPPALKTDKLYHTCKRMKDREGVRLFMIDYLQLMMEKKNFQTRHLEVSHIIRRIKEIAKELDVGMVVISTLARGTDDKSRPSLSMLKESGDIEYAADSIIFLWSPPEDDKKNFISDNVKIAIIEKQRNGPEHKDINVFWINRMTRFANYAKEEERNGKASAYADD